MTHAKQKTPLVTENSRKKVGEPTQIGSPVVTKMTAHANKRSLCNPKVNQNWDILKCSSFEEITFFVLYKVFQINSTGLVRANVSIHNRKEISIYFYRNATMTAIHYLHGTVIEGHSLNDLNNAILRFEEIGKEVCHAHA